MNTLRNFSTQSIGMESIVNARDLGGFVMHDGRSIKKGLLLRGAALYKASENDLARLHNVYNVTHVFDLRKQEEVVHRPDKDLPGAQYHWLPTLDPDSGVFIEKMMKGVPPSHFVEFMLANAHTPEVQDIARNFYIDMVTNEYTQVQYASFLQVVVHNTEGAIYWHCSQGKDRTGLAALFLLSAMGADCDTILTDFNISNEFYADLIAREVEHVKTNGGGEREINVVKTFIGANIDYFNDALEIIGTQYGGMQQYLRERLFLSEKDIAMLKERYLE